ncbi:MAG: dihydrolipoamide acetyltransferase family protein [Bacillota bacterium]
MIKNVVMPQLGLTMSKGKIAKWLLEEGDTVEKGAPLLVVETEKVTIEIEVPVSGVLGRVVFPAGETVPVGTTIAVIATEGEDLSNLDLPPVPGGKKAPEPGPVTPGLPAAKVVREEIKASPLARRIADEMGVDLSRVQGTGPGGRITKEDVIRARQGEETVQPVKAFPESGYEVIEMTAARRVTAERLAESFRSAPHYYVEMEVEATHTLQLREDLKTSAGAVRISITDVIVMACSKALCAHREVNSTIEDGEIRVYQHANVGLAVDTERGLLVPVVHKAETMSLREIAAFSRDLVERAREGRLMPDDFAGGTFTVSNMGMLGVDAFTAVLNPPQSAILAVGRVAQVARPAPEGVRFVPAMRLTLSADHRSVDGATAARFLRTVKGFLENPALML